MKKQRIFLKIGLISCVTAMIFSSCARTVNVPYFRDIPDSLRKVIKDEAVYKDPLIQPDDILSVTILLADPSSSVPVNQEANVPVSVSTVGTPTIVSGLLVDKNGDISFPIIGTVKVGGLSTSDAKDTIKKKAEKYYNDPDVQVRFANFKITVLGEVAHPSSYIVPNERVSVLDAIGLAGDLTIYGRRENVLVIRDNNGKREMSRMDLNNTDMFKSPYFFLKQNDIVYVEPNKSVIVQADAEQTKVFTVIASIVTGALLVFVTILRYH